MQGKNRFYLPLKVSTDNTSQARDALELILTLEPQGIRFHALHLDILLAAMSRLSLCKTRTSSQSISHWSTRLGYAI